MHLHKTQIHNWDILLNFDQRRDYYVILAAHAVICKYAHCVSVFCVKLQYDLILPMNWLLKQTYWHKYIAQYEYQKSKPICSWRPAYYNDEDSCCDSKECFLFGYIALSCRQRTIFLGLRCQAMVKPAAETIHTTEILWRDQEEKWEEGGVWTFLLPPTVSIAILELTWSLIGLTTSRAKT